MNRIIALFTIMLVPTICWAGGLNPVGRGPHLAFDNDISVIANNPAVMSRFEDTTTGLGVKLVKPTFSFKGIGQEKKSRPQDFYPMPSFGIIKRLNDKVVIGGGVYVPYGLGAKFEDNPEQLFQDTETMLALTSLSFGASWQSGKLALGAYLNGGISQFEYQAPFDLNRIPLPIPTKSKAMGFGLGASVGGLLTLSDHLKWGILYSSETKTRLNGETDISLGPWKISDDFKSAFTFPARLGTGLCWQNNGWRLSLDANYFWYSKAEKLSLDFENLPMIKTNRLDWEDNYSIHAEVWRQVNDRLAVGLGGDYMTAAITKTVSTLTPDGTGWDITASAKYQGKKCLLNGKLIYAWGDQDGGLIPSKYRAEVWVAELGVSW